MNKDNAHLYLPLVQALAEGKTLQHKTGDGWHDMLYAYFTSDPEYYRIKPASFPPKPESFEWHNPDGLTPEQVEQGYRLLVKEEADGGCHRMENSGYWDPTDSTWTYSSSWHWDKSSTICVPLSTPYPDGSRVVDGKLVKPWKLTREIPGFRPLRDGEEWHREDWTEEMLPEGWRPVIKGEACECQSASLPRLDWWDTTCSPAGGEFIAFLRTRRPLPEPAPKPAKVQLGPEDVPPGSVYRRFCDQPCDWSSITDVSEEGITVSNGGHAKAAYLTFYTWSDAMEGFIHRPGNLDANGKPVFDPCWKLQ